MRKGTLLVFAALITGMLASCDDGKPKHTDTLASGSIDISVDETYQPVIEEQLRVFDSSYPEAKIAAHYKPENECFKDFFDSKARLILVTRPLTQAEKDLCDQRQIVPSTVSVVKDAIALVVNNSSADSILNMDAVKGILTGVYKTKYTVVFDNEGSSTVRYITDSVLKGQKLGANVFAAKGNKAVVDYVEKNPNAFGIVGVSYVSDPNDTNNTGGFINNVKVVAIHNDTLRQSFQPYQADIALRRYPLVRNLYYIHRDTYPGLAKGFANFLEKERGQLIFYHADLFPLKMNIVIRDAAINTQPQ